MGSIRKKIYKSGPSWEARIHRGGIPALSKSFPTKAEAAAWIAATETKINKGGKPAPRKARDTLLSAALAEFEKENETTDKEKTRLKILAKHFDGFSVEKITQEVIAKYIKTLKDTEIPEPEKKKKNHPLYNGATRKKYAPSSVRLYYFQLKKVLEWHAIAFGYEHPPNLFKQDVPGAWEGERDRRLEGDEETRLLEALARGRGVDKGEGARLIRFALETGMRAQEILLARWKDFNEGIRMLDIPPEHVKTRKGRQVPLSKKAMAVLAEQKEIRGNEPVIFPHFKNSNRLGHEFKRWTKRAKIENLHFHDLRHEALSRIAERGKLDIFELMKMSGHTELKTLDRYVKLRASSLPDKLD